VISSTATFAQGRQTYSSGVKFSQDSVYQKLLKTRSFCQSYSNNDSDELFGPQSICCVLAFQSTNKCRVMLDYIGYQRTQENGSFSFNNIINVTKQLAKYGE